jgi:hypothetical protein
MAIAACTFESGNITIYVNDNYESSFFTKKNYFGKMVVLHELGHCLFKLKHTQNEIDIMVKEGKELLKEAENAKKEQDIKRKK